MIHIKWQKLTKLSHITVGKFLKNVVATLLVLISISPRLAFADGKPETTIASTTLPDSNAEESAEPQSNNYDAFKVSDNFEKTHPRKGIYKKAKFNPKSLRPLQQRPRPIANTKADAEGTMEAKDELYDKSKVFDKFEDFDNFEKTHNRYDIYREDVFDQAWMRDLRRSPLPIMDVRAVGSLVYPQNVNQAFYTNDIRHGKFYKVRYEKYRDTIVELSDQERKIINFALAIVFMDAKYVTAYALNDSVTLERLLTLAANIKSSEDLNNDYKAKAMRVLNRYLYY